ncbi:MAG TPA: SUMF1/EgtB/PvdO family nonheme iron enzyme [Thermotogota bacterium]|nr:SUMF1/EgtB/PvdO family nonheme iron enzyme [Thermotogota bacterium]
MEEYLIPPIKGQKKRTLPYYEIQLLIKRVSDAENNTSLETRLKQATEKAKAMFTVTSVLVPVKGGTFQMGDEYGDLEEWCQDRYEVYTTTTKTNPIGSDGSSYRIIRGGEEYVETGECRIALRLDLSPGNSRRSIGFRIARTCK